MSRGYYKKMAQSLVTEPDKKPTIQSSCLYSLRKFQGHLPECHRQNCNNLYKCLFLQEVIAAMAGFGEEASLHII